MNQPGLSSSAFRLLMDQMEAGQVRGKSLLVAPRSSGCSRIAETWVLPAAFSLLMAVRTWMENSARALPTAAFCLLAAFSHGNPRGQRWLRIGRGPLEFAHGALEKVEQGGLSTTKCTSASEFST